ncbi:MAG: sulfatase-like hydrolase/transferase [Lachnospiraceae bacterium]|nr:sulfatase-like hydrolase/transferase [Lachnospiraceae bacterium]
MKRIFGKIKPTAKLPALYCIVFALSLLFWEIILRVEIAGGISASHLPFLLFIPAQALFLTAINGLFDKIPGRILFIFTLVLLAVFYGMQLVYYRIFGSLISVSIVRMGGEAIANFGWTTKDVFLHSIGLMFSMLIPPIAVTVLILTGKIKAIRYPILPHLFVLLLSICLWFLASLALKAGGTDKQSAYDLYHSTTSDTDTAALKIGGLTTLVAETGAYLTGQERVADPALREADRAAMQGASAMQNASAYNDMMPVPDDADKQILAAFDFDKMAKETADPNLQELYTDLANRVPSYTNEYTGLLNGYNLILICAEAFWTYGIDEDVTPTLYEMSQNGIVLDNYYNSFRNTTVNGEYALLTGLWPDLSRLAKGGVDVGSLPQSSAKYMPMGLGTLFEKEGAASYAFHNYYGKYYRRSQSWKNLGFKHLSFMDEGMHFSTIWPSSDYEMMQQSVDKYINEDRFLAYYMTFSGHGPYNTDNCIVAKNLGEVKRRLGEKADRYSDESLGYLASTLELEYGMKYLNEQLEQKGIADHTLIVLTGDHYPYYLNKQGRNELAGRPLSYPEQFHSTCIMYTTGLKDKIVSDTYCCNVDIVPTLLNLYGIPYDSRLFMGHDIFSPGNHTAILYDKSFIDQNVVYTARDGKISDKTGEENDKEALRAYGSLMNERIDHDFLLSGTMLNQNFFYHAWKDAGLLSEEEAERERKRESEVAEELLKINEADAPDPEENTPLPDFLKGVF